MSRCDPVEMRKSLEMVQKLKQAGIWFVPIPVNDYGEYLDRVAELQEKIGEIIHDEAEKLGGC